MNKSCLAIFFLFICSQSHSQTNLIYNGDFELYDTCPLHVSWALVENPYQIEHCLGWKAPTVGSSDFFHTCGGPTVDVPLSSIGYQFPFSGSAYLGFYAASYDGGYPSGLMWWEYIQGRLTEPLKTGHTYRFSMMVTLAEVSTYTIDEIGLYFSSTAISSSTTYPLNMQPQIKSPDQFFFTDTTNWVLVEGEFQAAGGEQYITIGNFNDSITTDTILFNNYDSTFHACYLFIDYASVTDLSEIPLDIPSVFTPNEDGFNELFSISGLIAGDEVMIFNRWGTPIYTFAGIEDGWDGRTTSGKRCEAGVYYYVVSNSLTGRSQKGFVHLLR